MIPEAPSIAAPVAQGASNHSTPIESRAIKPIFVVGGLYSLSNGVAWIMKDLAAALGKAGAAVDVYGAECPDRGLASIGYIFETPTRWIAEPGRWLGGLSWSPRLKSRLRSAIESADVVHNHSVWMLPNSYATRAAHRAGKPSLYTAHGALEPWALENRGWKKRVAGAWFQYADLRNADCIHVNSEPEAEGVRKLGIKSPIAVIPNGVNLEEFPLTQDAEPFLERFPHLRGRRLMLFMARVHQKKGLGHLLPAWGRLAKQFSDWHLVVAGPDGGFLASARQLVVEDALQDRVTFTGMLEGDVKRAARAACELFVQPSFSEGFSMAILEALACAKPVLMTPGCNFPGAASAGAAVEVQPDIDGTTEGLRELLGRNSADLVHRGACGRRLVEERHTWDRVARETLALYGYLRHGGAKPSWIIE
jgi:glycosyltransferase involved in cell wall biosynthesis